MTEDKAQQLLDSLMDQGFDKSSVTTDDDDDVDDIDRDYAVRVRCSQCAALAINGVACHETGCPNIVRERFNEDEWGDE